MNKANLKSYAPKARQDFIKAVTERANVLGISAAGTVPARLRGDVAIIDGREWPAKVATRRDELVVRIKRHGFEQIIDEVAYTWFNRFAALRYMEIHDYLDHGWRVLSSRDGGLPEILSHASEVALPGLNSDRARDMQLAGNQDNELYKLLLVAQCNELSRVMPFLFERIDDETELLLPENLLRTDSIVAKLVESVPEEDWQEIEVIGWLYQFYISEKKDQVIGKVVKSEDIPAATQLFTPNWIVQYLVQNSVGRLWLMANPTSTLARQWPYYIKPIEQTDDAQVQLDTLIQTRIRDDGEALNPETITVLDPACGSGHILVVAYDVLKAIYLERGYQSRAIPRLILEKNLYGLDIDDRAAQLAAFALVMKARADDRRLLIEPPKLNVLNLRETRGVNVEELARHLVSENIQRGMLVEVFNIFRDAKTFGSLIEIPPGLAQILSTLSEHLSSVLRDGDLYARKAAADLRPLVEQALVLAKKFDVFVANPPYMGAKYFDVPLKKYVLHHYQIARGDLYACFILRGLRSTKAGGVAALITIPNWMFLSTFEGVRDFVLSSSTIETFSHNGRGVFGSDFGSCAFTLRGVPIPAYMGSFKRLFSKAGSVASNEDLNARFLTENPYFATALDFKKICGSPLAYWASNKLRDIFQSTPNLGTLAETRQGLATTNNALFIRQWHELNYSKIGFGLHSIDEALRSSKKWFPLNKGGSFRRWFGNGELVINFENGGKTICDYIDNTPGVKVKSNGRVINRDSYFKEGLTWSSLSIGGFSMRYSPRGYIFETKGAMCFPHKPEQLLEIIGLFNSKLIDHFLGCLSPTVDYHEGPLKLVPVRSTNNEVLRTNAARCIELYKDDWNLFETSWDFGGLPLVSLASRSLKDAWETLARSTRARREELKALEYKNNQILIAAYDLQEEIAPEVMDDQITLSYADRERDSQNLISYAIGCMMGRYSLDDPGLIYAHAGNVGFDAARYARFKADADGIIPLTGKDWFEDAAGDRLREFLRTVWGSDSLEENMAWLAESVGTKANEGPEEAICRYLADKFFKDHLQSHKRRPIYWLFSSGKQGAFQALVYVHRYSEGTLARMRAEYVVPLIAKVVSRLDMLDKDLAAASSAAARTKLQKQIESLRKKQIELLAYDEKLRHYADMRISLDLDDGVKVNYAKFGDLVAEAKAITGGSDE